MRLSKKYEIDTWDWTLTFAWSPLSSLYEDLLFLEVRRENMGTTSLASRDRGSVLPVDKL